MKNKLIALFFATFLFLGLTSSAYAVETHRIYGENRYETAANIAKEGWTSSEWAIIAYGGNFPDALAATPLAAKHNAPILLTDKQSLTNVTKDVLQVLGVSRAIIIGGPSAISLDTENQIKNMGITVTRISGADRYETSVKIADTIAGSQLIVTNGTDYANALSVSSYAGKNQIPIILSEKNSASKALNTYLSGHSIDRTFIIGDTGEISNSVMDRLPNPIRINGSDKYGTNLAVLGAFDFDLNNIFIATGNNFADALAGSAYAAKINAPIVLIDKIKRGDTSLYLTSNNSGLMNILGGESAVPESLLNSYLNISSLTAKEIFNRTSPSVVYIETYNQRGILGTGSGFAVEPNKIVTNYHVIDGSDSARIKTSGGAVYDLYKVTAYDKNNDIAILEIPTNLKNIPLGNSDSIQTGDKVYAIGSPLGLENTISDGLISSKSRIVNDATYIQISVPISHGSSGGALINEQGQVIGITAAGIDKGQNLNFAIPINMIKPMLSQDINKTLAEISPPARTTPVQVSDVFFPLLPDVPMPIGASYVRTGITETTAFYYYDWHSVPTSFYANYDSLLQNYGWTYHAQNKTGNSTEVYYAKGSWILGIGIQPEYMVVYGAMR